MPCVVHPGSASTVVLFNRSYCARCQRDIQAAVAQLDPHVTPRDCFVWYKGRQDVGHRSQGLGAHTMWPINSAFRLAHLVPFALQATSTAFQWSLSGDGG
jgi:hypothetical protein